MNSVIERPSEKAIYEELWQQPEYRLYSPGEEGAQLFLTHAQPRPGASVIDFGCGTGRGGLLLAILGQMNVTLLDFAPSCLDDDIRPMLETQAHTLRFVEADLADFVPVTAQYGFCADVMEHIPPELVDRTLDNILRAAQHVWFQINTKPDKMGALVGHSLHLTVRPMAWWLQKLAERQCIVHFSHEEENGCFIYATGWTPGQAIVDAGVLNASDEEIVANVRHNISQGWQQVSPHQTNEIDVLIIGSGPSLDSQEAEIRRRHDAGAKIVTLNGAYNWCQDRGIGPVNQIVVDARAFNARFTHPVDERSMYFIASQCNPSVLDGLPRARTYLWHTSAEQIVDALNEGYGDREVWFGIPGGSTVLLRAIPLMRLLGFRKFHLFGCDSCLTEDAHHAFAQPENDGALVVPVEVGSRMFRCHPWMAAQGQEFVSLIRALGEEVDIEVHGGGLLAWILEYAAGQYDEGMLALQEAETCLA